MSTEVADWKEEARSLRRAGLSEREIAESVGKAASSVHEAVKDVEPDDLDAGGEPVDPEALARAAGLSQDELDAQPSQATPGQQTIDGGEVPPAPDPRPEEIILRGTTPLDFFNAGGKRPNKASIRFTGGKTGLEQGTAFKKGDVIHFEGYATVVSAAPRDKRDKQTGIVVECELQIQAEIDDLRLTEPT
jgi:hypothetical protein